MLSFRRSRRTSTFGTREAPQQIQLICVHWGQRASRRAGLSNCCRPGHATPPAAACEENRLRGIPTAPRTAARLAHILRPVPPPAAAPPAQRAVHSVQPAGGGGGTAATTAAMTAAAAPCTLLPLSTRGHQWRARGTGCSSQPFVEVAGRGGSSPPSVAPLVLSSVGSPPAVARSLRSAPAHRPARRRAQCVPPFFPSARPSPLPLERAGHDHLRGETPQESLPEQS